MRYSRRGDITMLGYRKFIIVLVALLAASVLMWFGKISDGVYSTIIVACVGGFLTANVMQKNTKKEPAP